MRENDRDREWERQYMIDIDETVSRKVSFVHKICIATCIILSVTMAVSQRCSPQFLITITLWNEFSDTFATQVTTVMYSHIHSTDINCVFMKHSGRFWENSDDGIFHSKSYILTFACGAWIRHSMDRK